MLTRYREHLLEAWGERKARALPRMGWIVALVCAGVAAYIAMALAIAPEDERRDYHFATEGEAVTVLSGILLTSACVFSLAAATALVREKDRGWILWGIMTAGFGFLAFDEMLGFHESAGRAVEKVSGPGIFRSWNDIIVILYGVVALPLGLALFPMVLRYRRVVEFFVVGFVFYAVHTIIDSTAVSKTVLSVVCEESAKLFCGGFLALGAYAGLLGVLWRGEAR